MKTIILIRIISISLLLHSTMPLYAEKNPQAAKAIAIDSRRELFVDDYLIDQLSGKATLQLHHPVPREVVMIHDQPWEGSGSGYHSVFKDGPKYRMYYKAWQHTASSDLSNVHPLFCAYAESDDGIHWTKPNLGLHEYKGSKDNNIVFASGSFDGFSLNAGHPAVFKDENPAVGKDALYKAILISGNPKRGLVAYQSADGINWKPVSSDPIITDGAFDSQNLAFWDSERKEYRAYWRYFTKSGFANDEKNTYVGTRAIRTATSTDFITWHNQANITYLDSPEEELYTNQIKAYHRAPHIHIGFPARYIDRGWSNSMETLPEYQERKKRAAVSQRYGTALTESLLMASRDGKTFKRWNEAFLRPGMESNGTWTYGDQYIAWHIVETKSDREGAPDELSLYATEHYWKGKASALRRYTLRLDGFVSANAPMDGGELITKPLTFTGSQLLLNFSTSAAGDMKVEIQDENGKPIPGYTTNDCSEIFGDTVSRAVHWKDKGTDVSHLKGKIIKLRFVLKDADLYSFKFE